jgi:hypothetical protein
MEAPIPKWINEPITYGEISRGNTFPRADMMSILGRPNRGHPYMIPVIATVPVRPANRALLRLKDLFIAQNLPKDSRVSNLSLAFNKRPFRKVPSGLE